MDALTGQTSYLSLAPNDRLNSVVGPQTPAGDRYDLHEHVIY